MERFRIEFEWEFDAPHWFDFTKADDEQLDVWFEASEAETAKKELQLTTTDCETHSPVNTNKETKPEVEAPTNTNEASSANEESVHSEVNITSDNSINDVESIHGRPSNEKNSIDEKLYCEETEVHRSFKSKIPVFRKSKQSTEIVNEDESSIEIVYNKTTPELVYTKKTTNQVHSKTAPEKQLKSDAKKQTRVATSSYARPLSDAQRKKSPGTRSAYSYRALPHTFTPLYTILSAQRKSPLKTASRCRSRSTNTKASGLRPRSATPGSKINAAPVMYTENITPNVQANKFVKHSTPVIQTKSSNNLTPVAQEKSPKSATPILQITSDARSEGIKSCMGRSPIGTTPILKNSFSRFGVKKSPKNNVPIISLDDDGRTSRAMATTRSSSAKSARAIQNRTPCFKLRFGQSPQHVPLRKDPKNTTSSRFNTTPNSARSPITRSYNYGPFKKRNFF